MLTIMGKSLYDWRMKKLLISLSFLPVFLFLAVPAYAQMLCPPAFANLCKIRAEKGGQIFGPAVIFFIVIAIIICLVFLVIGGMKWASSGGDQQKVAKARQTIISALVGLVIALCTFFIVGTVLGIFGLSLTKLQVPKLVPTN